MDNWRESSPSAGVSLDPLFLCCVRPHNIAREQLGKVLTLVSVSGQEEGEAQLLLRRLQAVEEEVRGGEEKKEERLAREEEGKRREEENRQLREQLKTATAASPAGDSDLVATLRSEVASLKAKEAEAADQVHLRAFENQPEDNYIPGGPQRWSCGAVGSCQG